MHAENSRSKALRPASLGVFTEKEGQSDWSRVSAGSRNGEMGSDRDSLWAEWRLDGVWPARTSAFTIGEMGRQ